jgi:dihydroorotate dehydrogenase (fumarate)
MKALHDLSVSYLGLTLRSPLVPSASPLSGSLDGLLEMEQCGAGAVVLPSLFEDPISPASGHEDRYVDEIIVAKRNLRIPIIASLNASTPAGWARLAHLLEQAGADALELNAYQMSLEPDVPSSQIEDAYVHIVRSVVERVKIPISIKIPPYFTNLAAIAHRLAGAGAKGLVFFSRVYQPDLDLIEMGPRHSLKLSTSAENRLPLQWISLLSNYLRIDLAASTGVQTGYDVLKLILSGATITQLCSVLMQQGIPWMEAIEQELREAMDTCQISSLHSARGILARHPNQLPGEVERDVYRLALQGYARIDVPEWRDEAAIHLSPQHKPTMSANLAAQH